MKVLLLITIYKKGVYYFALRPEFPYHSLLSSDVVLSLLWYILFLFESDWKKIQKGQTWLENTAYHFVIFLFAELMPRFSEYLRKFVQTCWMFILWNV